MTVAESFDRWLERETASLELLEELLERLQEDIAWIEALNERERAEEVIGYES
jgi:hypothetical protein